MVGASIVRAKVVVTVTVGTTGLIYREQKECESAERAVTLSALRQSFGLQSTHC